MVPAVFSVPRALRTEALVIKIEVWALSTREVKA